MQENIPNINTMPPPIGTEQSAIDDISSIFVEVDNSRNLTGAQEGQIRLNKLFEQQQLDQKQPDDPTVPRAIATGVGDVLTQSIAGVFDAINEAGETVEEIFNLPKQKVKKIAPAKTGAGQFTRSVTQFLTGFIPSLKATKAAKIAKGAQPYAAGFIADATVFDPYEARLSDLVQQYPQLQNPVTEYLQSDENDTFAEGKFKNGIEGLALGGLADGLFKTVKLIKKNKNLKEKAQEQNKTVDEAVKETEEKSVKSPAIRREEKEPEFIPFEKLAEDSSAKIQIFKKGKTKAKKEDAENINVNNLETSEQVKDLITKIAQSDSVDINQARREQIKQEETIKLAEDLGMTVDELTSRGIGEAFNAEQLVASRQLLVSSAENVLKIAKKAETGDEVQLALLQRALQQHKGIQLQVSGATAEAGRALSSLRIKAQSQKAQLQAINEALEEFGGTDNMKKIAEALGTYKTDAQVGKYIRDLNKARKQDMFYEVWINGLLSNPATHIVNIVSNASVVLNSVAERKIAGVFSKNIPFKEADAQAVGILEGIKEGYIAASRVLRTGEPTDRLTKLETQNKSSITAENLEASGLLGRAVDFIGNMVRLPGRLLLAGDEFFKSIAYRMELNAQAYRKASDLNLQGDEFVAKVKETLENPPEDIHLEAMNARNYQTFTDDLGKTTKMFQRARDSRDNPILSPLLKVTAPFIRTPINVASYALARTPAAPLSRKFREDIASGGAKKDLALARVALGSTFMAISSMYAMEGKITGNGPVNKNQRKILEMTGWKANSILIGDTYYSISRLDPIGQLLMVAANSTEIVGQIDQDDPDYLSATTAVTLAAANSFVSRTFAKGVFDFIEAYERQKADPNADSSSLIKWAQGMAASAVPSGIYALARINDPAMRYSETTLENIKKRVPGYSDELPPVRNMFGEPILLEGGLGPDIMSPIYKSTKKFNVVADEMVAQKVDIGMPSRTISAVKLTPQQYDRYVVLASGEDLKGIKSTLFETLKKQINSPIYKRFTDGEGGSKNKQLQKVIKKYREVAKKQLLQEFPELDAQINLNRIEADNKLTGQDRFSEIRSRLEKLTGNQ